MFSLPRKKHEKRGGEIAERWRKGVEKWGETFQQFRGGAGADMTPVWRRWCSWTCRKQNKTERRIPAWRADILSVYSTSGGTSHLEWATVRKKCLVCSARYPVRWHVENGIQWHSDDDIIHVAMLWWLGLIQVNNSDNESLISLGFHLFWVTGVPPVQNSLISPSIFSLLYLFWENKSRLMESRCCVCVSPCRC
jgi:hypothetical protein